MVWVSSQRYLAEHRAAVPQLRQASLAGGSACAVEALPSSQTASHAAPAQGRGPQRVPPRPGAPLRHARREAAELGAHAVRAPDDLAVLALAEQKPRKEETKKKKKKKKKKKFDPSG